MRNISQAKIELIKKIVNAKLTKQELQAVTDKANEIISRRPFSKNSTGNGATDSQEINLYEQTDVAGILKEALNQ